jgi:surface polysaccharide O-acyltransferase-like enzyme
LIGDTSSVIRTLLTTTTPVFTLLSGNIIFVENRTGVERSSDGIEQFRFVLGF